MKKLLALSSLVMMLVSPAYAASVTKKLICEETKNVFTSLFESFGEKPKFLGEGTDDDINTSITLLVNSETGTWTIVQFRKDVACILATGDSANISTK